MARTIDDVYVQLYNDFQPFFNGMIDEMHRHFAENGDSWKTCKITHLKHLLDKAMIGFFDNPSNVSHLLDVGNFCAMYYIRHNSEEKEAE